MKFTHLEITFFIFYTLVFAFLLGILPKALLFAVFVIISILIIKFILKNGDFKGRTNQ